MKNDIENITVIIRSSRERTVPHLIKSVTTLLPGCNVHLVEKSPFFNTVVETFNIARRSSTLFTLALDGDVILDTRAPELLRNCMRDFDLNQTVRRHFRVKDKFLGIRDAGNHLFNNRYAERFHQFLLEKGNRDSWRPESGNLRQFADTNGLQRDLDPADPGHIIGLHAFEQYYQNIFWGMRNFAVKCLRDRQAVLERLKGLATQYVVDLDYAVALEGFRTGMLAKNVVLDRKRYTDISDFLQKLGTQEKSPL